VIMFDRQLKRTRYANDGMVTHTHTLWSI